MYLDNISPDKKHHDLWCFFTSTLLLFLFDFACWIDLAGIHLAHCVEWAKSYISSHERDDTDEEPVRVLHEVETREQGSADRHTDESVDGTSITFHKKEG